MRLSFFNMSWDCLPRVASAGKVWMCIVIHSHYYKMNSSLYWQSSLPLHSQISFDLYFQFIFSILLYSQIYHVNHFSEYRIKYQSDSYIKLSYDFSRLEWTACMILIKHVFVIFSAWQPVVTIHFYCMEKSISRCIRLRTESQGLWTDMKVSKLFSIWVNCTFNVF